MAKNPPHFVRDPSLASDIADQFGGGAGNAEQLIEANNLRYSEVLNAAQLTAPDPDRDEDFDAAAIAKVADIDEKNIVAHAVRGNYLVFAYEAPDGRVHKEALLIEDDKLVASDEQDSPARAQIRAAVEAANAVQNARSEAEQVIADAEAKAAEIIQKASQEAEEQRAAAVADANKAAAKDAAKDAPPKK